MKRNENFVLREIAGEYVMVPIGSATLDFNGLMTVNEVGRFIWQELENETTQDALVKRVMEEYEVDIDTATADTAEFIKELKKMKLI